MGNSLFDMPGGTSFFDLLEDNFPTQSQLFHFGKLTDDWSNVKRHCLVQTAAIDILCELMSLPKAEVVRMAEVAMVHDTRKRIDIMYDKRLRTGMEPMDFTEEEVAHFDQLFRKTIPNLHLLEALNPSFLPKVLAREASFLQLVQFLVDDMAKGEEIVPFDERIDEVSARNQNPEPEVEKILCRPYWEVEREVGHRVIDMVTAILNARYIPFDETNPAEAIADLINQGIMRRISEVR